MNLSGPHASDHTIFDITINYIENGEKLELKVMRLEGEKNINVLVRALNEMGVLIMKKVPRPSMFINTNQLTIMLGEFNDEIISPIEFITEVLSCDAKGCKDHDAIKGLFESMLENCPRYGEEIFHVSMPEGHEFVHMKIAHGNYLTAIVVPDKSLFGVSAVAMSFCHRHDFYNQDIANYEATREYNEGRTVALANQGSAFETVNTFISCLIKGEEPFSLMRADYNIVLPSWIKEPVRFNDSTKDLLRYVLEHGVTPEVRGEIERAIDDNVSTLTEHAHGIVNVKQFLPQRV